MDNQLLQVLRNTFSEDHLVRKKANDDLDKKSATEYDALALALSQIMADQQVEVVLRKQAARELIKVVNSHEDHWLQMRNNARASIKTNCCQALAAQDQGGLMAAQALARVACVELPRGHWPDVMALLVANITGGVSSEALKQASLEAIGYICDDLINPGILAPQFQDIFDAISMLLQPANSNGVRIAAAHALRRTLAILVLRVHNKKLRDYLYGEEFQRKSPEEVHRYLNRTDTIDRKGFCNAILDCVLQHMSPADVNSELAEVLLRCLMETTRPHYIHMEFTAGRIAHIKTITERVLGSPLGEMVLQGIQFWCMVCMEELKLEDDKKKFLPLKAVEFVVPLLLEILERQEEGDDEDLEILERQVEGDDEHKLHLHNKAGVCLRLLSQACGESIVELVLPYVQQSIQHEDDCRRNAAVWAFASILEGPSPGSLEPLFTLYMPVITNLLADPVPVVRETASFTFDRVCKVHPEVPLDDQYLPKLLETMVASLSKEPKVATNFCWAFSSLVKGAAKLLADLDGDGQSGEASTYKLSQYFADIVDKLLETAKRHDCGQSGLRNAAYIALIEMFRSAPRDCYPKIQDTTVVMLQKLEGILGMEQAALSAQDRSQLAEYQSVLCMMVNFVLRKIDRAEAMKIADQIMSVLKMMFERAQSNAAVLSKVQRDFIVTVNKLINAIGPAFNKYLAHFMPVLLACLQNSAEPKICTSAVVSLRYLTRQVAPQLVPYLDEVFRILFNSLRNPNTDRSLLKQIISAFGDFARLLGDSFAQYRGKVIKKLIKACLVDFDLNDPDTIDYLNILIQSFSETFVGLIQDARSSGNGNQSPATAQENIEKFPFIIPRMQFIIPFMAQIALQQVSSEELIGNCCYLVGDIATVFGKDSLKILVKVGMEMLLDRGRRCTSANTKKAVDYAASAINKLNE